MSDLPAGKVAASTADVGQDEIDELEIGGETRRFQWSGEWHRESGPAPEGEVFTMLEHLLEDALLSVQLASAVIVLIIRWRALKKREVPPRRRHP